MKEYLRGLAWGTVIALAMVGSGVVGQIVSSLPFTLQNATVADATQVMANFNQIVANVNANGAKNGANSDITALTALTTPITAAQGGATEYVGGTSTGTANAQVVSTTPTTFTLTAPYRVIFTAGFSNTGATTLNAQATGVKNIFRVTSAGPVALVGGEIIAGAIVEVAYDGTQYQLRNAANNVPIGTSIAFRGATTPSGYLLEDGACVSRTTYAVLFGVISTTYGVCDGSTTFGLPDSRGRLNAGRDDMGGSAANRITNAGSGCIGTTLGLACGAQNVTLARTSLPNDTLAISVASGQGAHTHPYLDNTVVGGSGSVVLGSGVPTGDNSRTTSSNTLPAMTGTSPLNGGVTQTATALLNPLLIVNRGIKY